jgi:hypothetical protein
MCMCPRLLPHVRATTARPGTCGPWQGPACQELRRGGGPAGAQCAGGGGGP